MATSNLAARRENKCRLLTPAEARLLHRRCVSWRVALLVCCVRNVFLPRPPQALLEKEADLRQEELDEACAAAPVSRLVLVVHGIGQKLEGANVAQVGEAGGWTRCAADEPAVHQMHASSIGWVGYWACRHLQL